MELTQAQIDACRDSFAAYVVVVVVAVVVVVVGVFALRCRLMRGATCHHRLGLLTARRLRQNCLKLCASIHPSTPSELYGVCGLRTCARCVLCALCA